MLQRDGEHRNVGGITREKEQGAYARVRHHDIESASEKNRELPTNMSGRLREERGICATGVGGVCWNRRRGRERGALPDRKSVV